ncbi:spore protease YyaC [Anaeroselena agilis]|uniref:Spore protease YyaC n=1 Tax=Anaeroselena agilis TaxID=3063788 RepID=A0ABU3NYL3_9FIRM|nr:spore protease YyaC [Selenomonadales bacterium 4137-cl]
MGKADDKLIVNLREGEIVARLAGHCWRLLNRQEGIAIRPIIALCIGSDRYTGDALGPLVGSHLEEYGACTVYGSLDHPVHAGNLVETVGMITARHPHAIIVAVDACLGRAGEIGNIEAWEGGIEAGIAVGNRLPCVGHVSIVGVVNAGGHLGYLDLQNTPLAVVVKLSRVIGEALADVLGRMAARDAAAVVSRVSGGTGGPTSGRE